MLITYQMVRLLPGGWTTDKLQLEHVLVATEDVTDAVVLDWSVMVQQAVRMS